MSAIVRETSEYVEMSDSITLCIVKDGAAGTSINMKTGVSSPDTLPSSGASIGDSYIIDGHLWTYTGGTASDATHRNGFTDCGKVSGEAGKNNYVHVAWSNKQPPLTKDDIVLSNTDGNAYAYMGTWVSETKEDTADEAVKKAKWVYVKGDKGTPGKDAVTYGVQVTPTYEVWSDAKKHAGIVLTFTKTTGSTMLKYPNVQALGTAKLYVDGTELEGLNKWVNGGSNKIIFDSFTFDGTNNTASIGTASVISIELIVDDKIVATANYANGKQGVDGKGALEIICDPETIVLDTDDNGLVKDYSNAWAGLMCVRDGKEVSGVTYNIGKHDTVNCDATVNNNGIVTITSVDSQTVTIDGSTVTVSSTSGSVTVNVTEDATGVTYTKTVPFAVNVARYTGGLKADNKKFESAYNYLTNKGTSTDFSYYESHIKQTAKEISLKVSEKQVGRRNLLVGSAFRKQGEGCSIVQDGQDAINGICINGGYDGVNCARLRNEGNAGAAYPRISWDGGRNSNVKVAKGKKYTLSFWAKRLSSTEGGYEISTQFFLQDGANGYARPYGALKFGSFTVKSQGEWEFIQDTVTIPSNAKSNYVEVCICLGLLQSGMAEILVCRPMLEEGEEYNGWTLSEQDYDYVGGNLLDGTGTLVKTGNVEVLNSAMVTQGGMGESASIRGLLYRTAHETDFLQYSTANMGLKANEDYVLSFYARTSDGSSAGLLQCYLYPSEGNINTEESEGGYDNTWNPNDGDLKYGIIVSTQWKRYWVHWRPTKNDPQHVLFRLLRQGNDRGNYSSSTSYAVGDIVLYDGTYYKCKTAGSGNTPSSSSSYWEAREFAIEIARPKLEVGATMTEWTAKRADMVDKQALYATGIDIDAKKITITASNTRFRDNDGNELAVIDGDGLRATRIATTGTNGRTVISGNTTIWYNKDGVTPGIKVFYDEAGVPHFQFCNSNGKVMYDFGPSGLQSFISSTQKAYSDVCYLRDASSHVRTNTSGVLLGFSWCYVARNQSGDLRYIYRKQIPTTPESSKSEIYSGCVFTSAHKYEGMDWPAANTTLANGRLLADGWYVRPNDGNLPMKPLTADEEAVFDPTRTLYYQTFYYYSSGKVARTVRAYMKKVSDTQVSKFKANGDWDEI